MDDVLRPDVIMLLVVSTVHVTLDASALLQENDGALTVTEDDRIASVDVTLQPLARNKLWLDCAVRSTTSLL